MALKQSTCSPCLATPDDLLGELFAHFTLDQPASDITRGWLTSGILRAVRTGDSLDSCLSLAGAGKVCLSQRLLMIRRDLHLNQALQNVAIDTQLSPWKRCVRLAPLVKTFQGITWRHVKNLSVPPSDWPAYKCDLWSAMKTGVPLPESAHGLRAVLAQGAAFSRNRMGSTLLAQLL